MSIRRNEIEREDVWKQPRRGVGKSGPFQDERRPAWQSLHTFSSRLNISAMHSKKGQAVPIGVFIHAFYEDVLPGIVEHVRRIPEPTRIYISTTTRNDLANIKAGCPEAEVRVFENRGRDIWPKLWGFGDKYAQHDVVLHLHTKKSVHSRGFRDWLDQILASLLGDSVTISAHVASLRAGEVGMICPPVHPKHIKSVRWRNNIKEAHKLLHQMGIEVSFDQKPFDFPVGSMFWSRADLLAPLLALDLPQSYFPDEQGQTDGTAAHAIERIYGVLAAHSGLGLRYTER